MGRYVYYFSPGNAEGTAAMKELLGAKGAGLAEMARLGLPVPPGMTVSTEACSYFLEKGTMPAGLRQNITEGIAEIEALTGRGWGDADAPLLLSVRGGGLESVPGMMDTVLNVGLNEKTLEGLISQSGNRRFAYDCWRRFIQMYAVVVHGLSPEMMEAPIGAALVRADVNREAELSARDWKDVIDELQRLLFDEAGVEIPDDPTEQLWSVIEAIYRTWDSGSAVAYRRMHEMNPTAGTGINIMTMVFGNLDEKSASGVAFTRNPATGEPGHYGEYLPCAQGEDVVGTDFTPHPLQRPDDDVDGVESLQEAMPHIYAQLCRNFESLEAHYRDMLDIEFTVESGKLWILEIRRGMRTGQAAVRVALDLIKEGLIDPDEAVMRVDPQHHVPEFLGMNIDPRIQRPAAMIYGLAASSGAVVGRLVTSTAEALARSRRGESVVLVRQRTTSEDLAGLQASSAVITSTGGLSSHAAAQARRLGMPCICGARDLSIAADGSGITAGDHFIARGEILTVDGTAGEAYIDELPLVEGGEDPRLQRFLEICDRHRRLEVRVNADTVDEVRRGINLGAEGVGLCRTEQILLCDEDRLMTMRRAILDGGQGQSAGAFDELLHFHRHDAAQILRALAGRPVTMRLLDPPLSRFLPTDEISLVRTAANMEIERDEVIRRVEALGESHPMMGLRGCRLGLVQPALYQMQVQAIVEAMRMVIDDGISPVVEILIPMVSGVEELRRVVESIEETIWEHLHGAYEMITLDIGAMIQLPRAALLAEDMARFVDFICFDTDELTQLTWGMSREDSRRFMSTYVEQQLLAHDPFEVLDRVGVGELLRTATFRGRRVDEGLTIGVYGGHAREARSVRFFESLDIDYLTVAPQDVPAARVAAARAFVAHERALAERVRA